MKRKYWYLFEEYHCPVCQKVYKHKYREYGDKPKEHGKRYRRFEMYDYCEE